MNKVFILLMLTGLLMCQSVLAQQILPLGLRFETVTNYDNAEWRWTPTVTFRLAGPVDSSANITVEYTNPNGVAWVTAKCKLSGSIEAGKNYRFDFCGKDIDASKAINQTGIFKFQIKLNDPLSGANKTLYSGKFTIGKNLYNIDGTPDKNKQFHYFVNNDFRLGYAFLSKSVDEIYAEVWLKNKIMSLPEVNGYLFYNGKQIEEKSPGFPLNLHPKENAKESFGLVELRFWDSMNKPGEYEIKVKRAGEFVRSAKFTIGADGNLVNNNIGREIVSGTDILVPAQILGTSDGIYNKLALKEGIFGNPISNLIAP